MGTVDKKVLKELGDKANDLIWKQAQKLLSEYAEPHMAKIAEAFRPFGLTHAPMVWVHQVWEDVEEGKRPPKVMGELQLYSGKQIFTHTFDVSVGSFHSTTKKDRIFELCMLRAEVNQELSGGGDGHVVDRMAGLFKEIEEMGW